MPTKKISLNQKVALVAFILLILVIVVDKLTTKESVNNFRTILTYAAGIFFLAVLIISLWSYYKKNK